MSSALEGDVCSVLTEMQKTEYMVFAGRQYFLGDKCQVTLATAAQVTWDGGVSCCHWHTSSRLLLVHGTSTRLMPDQFAQQPPG